MKLGVAICTFGDDAWREKGELLLGRSFHHQPTDEWLALHSPTLGLAATRNSAAHQLKARGCDYIVFLDADDELDSTYCVEMRRAIDQPGIYRPSTLGVYPDGSTDDYEVMIPRTHMGSANCIVVGAACPVTLFEEVGGFDPSLDALEDWDLWCKMILAGAKVYDVPRAVYRVGVNNDGRNSDARQKATRSHSRSYSEIRRRYRKHFDELDIR